MTKNRVFKPEEILEVWKVYVSDRQSYLDNTKPLTTGQVAYMMRNHYNYASPYLGGNQCVLPALRKLVETGLVVTTIKSSRYTSNRHLPMATDEEYRWMTQGLRVTYSDRLWAPLDVAAAHRASLDLAANEQAVMEDVAGRVVAAFGVPVEATGYRTTVEMSLGTTAAHWLAAELEWARARRELDALKDADR